MNDPNLPESPCGYPVPRPLTGIIGTTLLVLFVLLFVPCQDGSTFLLAGTPAGNDLVGRTIKEIRITGLEKTKERVVLRELSSKVGEPYTPEKSSRDLQRLDRLRIFSSIVIRPIIDESDLILLVDVQETASFFPIVGFDSSDENGLSIGPGIMMSNVKGEAIRFKGKTRFGGATQVKAELANPWFAGNHASYKLWLSYLDRFNDFYGFNERSLEMQFDLGSYIGENGRAGARVGFLSLESDEGGITLSPDNRDMVPNTGFYVGYDSRDLWTNPSNGWWSELEVSNYGSLWGDADFWSFTFDVRRYQPIADRHTLALFSLATIRTGALSESVPAYLNFRLGGANTVRGWDLDSSAGKNQFINTAEYRYTLMKRRPFDFKGMNLYAGLQLALFADFGIAWNDSNEFQAGNFIDGYGFGLRLLIPFVEVLRFDFAFGQPDRGIGSAIGVFEKAIKQRERVR